MSEAKKGVKSENYFRHGLATQDSKDNMKKQMKHQNGNGQTARRIRIEFTHRTASEVAIAGTFNDWRPDATQMVALGGGRWLKELALSPGVYEYRLVVDGAWMADP